MPLRLPRLTLFTAPNCSLCEVVKADLHQVNKIAPFELTLYNIRKQPSEDPSSDSALDRTAWRRLYQYDIPVLHWSVDDSFDSLAGRNGKEKDGQRGGDKEEGPVKDFAKRSRSPTPPLLSPCASPRPSKRPRPSSPPARPNRTPSPSSSPPLFILSASPSEIVPDSHYASFGLGFSYSYFPSTNPNSSSLEILGESQTPPPPSRDPSVDPASGQILNHLMPPKSCFNCSSPDHSLSQCPFRRDHNEISKNREFFQQSNANSSSSSYHRLSDSRNNPLLPSNSHPSDRHRFLHFHFLFKPGLVSSTLRHALGLVAEGEGYTTEELPWMGRIRDWGYPNGWSWIEGEMSPDEKSKRVIEGRRGEGDEDWEFDEVELLDMYDQEEKEILVKSKESSPVILPPSNLPPPLPPNSPPPLPPGPPPPPPPPPSETETARKINRQVDYKSYLFDSRTHFLSFSPDRYYASFNRDVVETRDGVRGTRQEDAGVEDGEEEMDFGDSSDEGN